MASAFTPIKPRIGARATLRRDELLDPGFARECMSALERYGILVFPEIGLDDDEQIALAKNLGEIIPQGAFRPDGSREVLFKISLDPRENPDAAEYLKITVGWHIDGLVEDVPPPKATILSARRLSPTGGQTEWCSTYAAYDDLSEAQQERFETLRVLHSLEAADRRTHPDASRAELARFRARREPKEYPLVWNHKSGRKSLVLGVLADHVQGLPDAESRALLERLEAHATRPEIVYRHEWKVGDLLIWDNYGTMHRVIPYDANSGRLMHRAIVHGIERIS